MRDPVELSRDLVFVGGGHAHALALRMLAMRPIAGLRITLISPSSHTPYSGMLPGLVAGHYSFEQVHIDLARLCQWAGVRFIAAEVTALDPHARQLTLRGRPPVSYDLLSIDIGSQPELDSIPGARDHAIPVKPVAGLWRRWRGLEARVARDQGDGIRRIAVVGGGAGSVELSLAIAHRLGDRAVHLDLYCGAAEILQGYNGRARQAVERALRELGVELHLHRRVAEVRARQLLFAGAGEADFDELFWCTGASAAPWVAASGLSTDEQGFLAVRDTLQSLDDERVFGSGDIATQLEHPRAKAGVYAVRQGPVLAHNLRHLLLGRKLREHHPQQRFLSLVSLGGRRATADKGAFAATGDWVWRWKDHIDREFMARFEKLPENMSGRADILPRDSSGEPQPHCGGCGAKVGAASLGRVLRGLGKRFPGHCRAEDLGDDTAQIPGGEGRPLVQSLDVLRQLLADPWLMGRIAANHALSDLYASGARPLSALASVTLPFASEALLQRELEQLLAGALHEFAAADCRLTGGHSLQGAELNLGFVVNGAPPAGESLLPKTGLAPGDKLVLTKPLGTGALFAAHMQLRADGRDISHAIDSMLQSNAQAAELARAHGASACTDITGFGLAGHLLEMLLPGQSARLHCAALPVLPGALEALDAGLRSSMHEANAAMAAELARGGGARQIIFDPQTSGGLLIGIAAERAQLLCEALQSAGYAQAAIAGEVTETSADRSPALELA